MSIIFLNHPLRLDSVTYASAGMNIDDAVPPSRSTLISTAAAVPGQLEALYFDDQIVVSDVRQDGVAGILGYTHGNGVRRAIALDATGRVAKLTDRTPGLGLDLGLRPADTAIAPGRAWPSGSAWFADVPAKSSIVYQQMSRHDDAGRLVMSQRQQLDPEGGARQAVDTEHYAYDRLNRLTRITSGNREQTKLTYDRGGNRSSLRDASGTQHYRYGTGTNRLIAVTGTDTVETDQVVDSNHVTGTLRDRSPAVSVLATQRLTARLPAVTAHGALSDVATERHDLVKSAWLFDPTGVPLLQFDFSQTNDHSIGPAARDGKSAARSGPDGGTNTGVRRDDQANPGGARRTIYNTARRPIALLDTSGKPVAQYHYNALGERIAKTVFGKGTHGNAATIYSLYREQRLAAQANVNGHILAHYVYLDGKPIAKIMMQPAPDGLNKIWRSMQGLLSGDPEKASVPAHTTGAIHAIHTDHLGTPQVVTNARQKVVWQAHTAPFGQARLTSAPTTVDDASTFTMDLRLPGQIFDAETGLHYNYQRDYDPALGRYLTPDPIGLAGGLQPYGYVGSDPLNRTDQLGLYEADVHYYMTFFLARTAGLGYQEARTIALATQYIDDNPDTWPVDDANQFANVNQLNRTQVLNRLTSYHFTTTSPDWYSTTNYDPSRTTGEALYQLTFNAETQSYINRRYINPVNPQLRRLLIDAHDAPTRCGRAQFFGEFLHAFEDTFGHRDQNNAPIPVNAGFGHGAYGHSPDKTYNHRVTAAEIASRRDIEILAIGEFGNWNQNEARTLEMEKEVFAKIQNFNSVGNGNQAPSNSNFEALVPFLQGWNRIQNIDEKIAALAFRLDDLGLGNLPAYSKNCAQAKRETYLGPLAGGQYPGAILPSNIAAPRNLQGACE